MVGTRLKFLDCMYERLETSLFNVESFCSVAWLKWEWIDCVSFHIPANEASFLHFVACETYPVKIRLFVVRHLITMDQATQAVFWKRKRKRKQKRHFSFRSRSNFWNSSGSRSERVIFKRIWKKKWKRNQFSPTLERGSGCFFF